MWINDGKIERQIKEYEEIPQGFIQGRKPKAKKIDKLKELVSKEDLIQYYIVENHSYTDTMVYFNLTCRKDLRLLLTEYGIAKDKKMAAKYAKRNISHEDYVQRGKKSSETQKKSWALKSESEKKAWSEKQKQAHSTENFKSAISKINIEYNKNLSEDIKSERNLQRSISCKKTWSDAELVAKQKSTAHKNRIERALNGQFCKTKEEQNIYDILIQSYPDIVYDIVVDSRYPYYVDFYIKSLDLFIEYQGHPSHGKYPYIENDTKSLEEANRLYGSWREQYLKLDVEKYQTAINSNINFIRIYPLASLEENIQFNKNKFIDLIQIIYQNACKK